MGDFHTQPEIEHTPTPWALSIAPLGSRLILREVPGMCDGGDYYCIAEAHHHSLLGYEESKANAAFIVEAVNSHAALKEQVAWWEEQFAQQVARVEELTKALDELQDAEQAYRMCHDLDGDGHVNTGRAWDKMRRAGRHARSALSLEGRGGAT